MPVRLKSGAWGAPGGKRKGAGRPANWFKKACADELAKKNLRTVHLIGEISRGEAKVEKIFQHEGEIVRAVTNVAPSDTISAASYLSDRAFGRPSQEVEVTGVNSMDLPSFLLMIDKSREERGLPND